MAHSCGVPVEGELGYVPGVEGEDAERHPGEIAYTTVEEARPMSTRRASISWRSPSARYTGACGASRSSTIGACSRSTRHSGSPW